MASVVSVQEGGDLSENLEFWMTNLPENLRTMPLIHLAIPGSHDSCTSSVKWYSKVAPDAEPIVQRLTFLGPLLGVIISRWARTQACPATRQLNFGIRYFDLRIATKRKTEELYIVHGQYSCGVTSVLTEIAAFLDEHPSEVVILDCQHFYAFGEQDHFRLIELFNETFGSKLLPYDGSINQVTLDYMTKNGYQVIVVYRNSVHSTRSFLWPPNNLPTPWPETDDIDILISKLNVGLEHRPKNVGYVSQCILTPTNKFVISHLCRSLKSTCVIPIQKQKYQWLSQQAPGVGGLNIVISDFIDLDACKFSREVISLNRKLLQTYNYSSQPLTPIDNSM